MLPKIKIVGVDGTITEKTKPIEVDIKPEKLSVGEYRMMRGRISEDSETVFLLMLDFLIHHTNWTEDEINQLTIDEVKEIMGEVREKERENAIPLSNSVNSDSGQEVTPVIFPDGQTTSPTPSNSDVTPKMLEELSMLSGMNAG